MACRRAWLLRRRREIVELDDRVRLRPDPELPRVLEGVVVLVDHLFAVEEHLDVVADHPYRQFVPHPRRYLAVPSREPVPAPLDDVVQVHVVLQGVRARDVVVILVLQAPDDPAALIALASDRLALDREAQVLQLGARVRDGKPVIGRIAVGLRKDVLAARRIAHRLYDPLAWFALAGEREVEPLRRLAGGIGIEIERRHLLLLGDRSRGDKCNQCSPLHVSAPRRLRLKYSYRSSRTALARCRRTSSSACAMAMPLIRCSKPALSGRSYFPSLRSMSWMISAIGRSAASVISKRASSTSNEQSSPWCVNSPSNMSKRSSPGWWRYSRGATNLNFALGSMNRRISHAIDVDAGAGDPGRAARLFQRLRGWGFLLRLARGELLLQFLEQSVDGLPAAGVKEVDCCDIRHALLQPRHGCFDLAALLFRDLTLARKATRHLAELVGEVLVIRIPR